MRDKDTSALREMFQYSSLAKKPLGQWEIATHWRYFQIQDKSRHCDPHLDQTKFNDLLPLTIDGVLITNYGNFNDVAYLLLSKESLSPNMMNAPNNSTLQVWHWHNDQSVGDFFTAIEGSHSAVNIDIDDWW